MHENGSSGHETAKLGRSKGVREFGTKRPRVRIPPLRLPEALIFLRFRVFCFWRICRFFPVYNLSGCSGSLRHPAADLKTSLPRISVNFRFFPRRKCLIYTSKATVPDNSDSRQSARYKFRCRSRTLGW